MKWSLLKKVMCMLPFYCILICGLTSALQKYFKIYLTTGITPMVWFKPWNWPHISYIIVRFQICRFLDTCNSDRSAFDFGDLRMYLPCFTNNRLSRGGHYNCAVAILDNYGDLKWLFHDDNCQPVVWSILPEWFIYDITHVWLIRSDKCQQWKQPPADLPSQETALALSWPNYVTLDSFDDALLFVVGIVWCIFSMLDRGFLLAAFAALRVFCIPGAFTPSIDGYSTGINDITLHHLDGNRWWLFLHWWISVSRPSLRFGFSTFEIFTFHEWWLQWRVFQISRLPCCMG